MRVGRGGEDESVQGGSITGNNYSEFMINNSSEFMRNIFQ